MVDFNFDVNELFQADITAVRSDLIPVGYLGNKNHSLVQQQVRENRIKRREKNTADGFLQLKMCGSFLELHIRVSKE